MDLSDNFTLEELTKSSTAERADIDNDPGLSEISALVGLARNILQPVRDHFGIPFSPSSGYRCIALNRAIGSKDTSQHIKGEAVDFEIPGVSNYELAVWIRENLDFDQLILEFYKSGDPYSGWVHCSYQVTGNNRKECLTINRSGTFIGLVK